MTDAPGSIPVMVAEDLKSLGPCGRAGSNPAPGIDVTVSDSRVDEYALSVCGLARSTRSSTRSPFGTLLLVLSMSITVLIGIAFYADESHAHDLSTSDCRSIAQHTDGSVLVKRAAARGCTRYRHEHAKQHELDACHGRVPCVIRFVFGPWGSQAVSVAWCESSFRTAASNGQYLGLFQMGSSERATYGHGPDALSQSRAAYAYFLASGRDWSPWECKP